MGRILPGGVITSGGSSRQNKTGTWAEKLPEVDKKKCIKCHQCVVSCPENCINIKKDKSVVRDEVYCKGCSVCASVCPAAAIKMKNR